MDSGLSAWLCGCVLRCEKLSGSLLGLANPLTGS